jgi:hypothetical protein
MPFSADMGWSELATALKNSTAAELSCFKSDFAGDLLVFQMPRGRQQKRNK